MGSGDLSCLKSSLEFVPSFGRYLGAGTRLALVAGTGSERGAGRFLGSSDASINSLDIQYSSSYRATNLGQKLYFFPFGNDRRLRTYLGVGGFVGYSVLFGYPKEIYNSTTRAITYDFRPERGVGVGYLASLNFDGDLGSTANWQLGGKLSFQNDTFGNTLLAGQLTVGRRL